MHQQLGTHRLRDRGTYTAGTASAAPVVELGRQISYFAVPVFVTERLAAILKIYKRLIRKTKNLLNIIQKAAENAKLGWSGNCRVGNLAGRFASYSRPKKIKHANISGCVRCVQLCVFACLTVKVIVRSFWGLGLREFTAHFLSRLMTCWLVTHFCFRFSTVLRWFLLTAHRLQ